MNKATIVVDLGFGDAGKGSIVDYLSRQANKPTVVRFNGGGQAAHNVVTADGRHHTFHQFGSGSFVPGVRTHLSRYMLLDPETLLEEAERLQQVGCGNVFSRLTVDENAKVVTPFHKAGNRLRELERGAGEHGTCGMGIGETMADHISHPELTVYVRDLRNPTELVQKLQALQEMKRASLRETIAELETRGQGVSYDGEVFILEERTVAAMAAERMWRAAMKFIIVPSQYLGRLAKEGDLIFEGAQGVLLDEWYGFHPHTTWSTTTFSNALELLDEIGYSEKVEKLGVLRAYSTRHGAGPFVVNNPILSRVFPEDHNRSDGWQKDFRVGWFDLVMARYALAVCGGADSLAITCLDRLSIYPKRTMALYYSVPLQELTPEIQAMVEYRSDRDSPLAQVFSLRPKTELTDLAYQERLAAILRKSLPIFGGYMSDESLLVKIESQLNVPVTVVSYGPTAADKRARASRHKTAAA